jgi:hypothetical protein
MLLHSRATVVQVACRASCDRLLPQLLALQVISLDAAPLHGEYNSVRSCGGALCTASRIR